MNSYERLGQSSFRLEVLAAYELRCAVTGERTLPVLEAAHIKPFSLVKAHSVDNGLSLRSDIHRLYDQGYVSVTPDLVFRDPYVLDFLGLRDTFSEKDLEAGKASIS